MFSLCTGISELFGGKT